MSPDMLLTQATRDLAQVSPDVMKSITVIFDLRCLQDVAYRERGIGRLGFNLLRSAREVLKDHFQATLIGLVDPALLPLEERFRDCLDGVITNAYFRDYAKPSWFIQLSPVTHDPLFIARILDEEKVFKVTIVHDFIPLQSPHIYLPTLAQKVDFQAKLCWLARYDHYFPNSRHTSQELKKAIRIPDERISITAAPIDPTFLEPDLALKPPSFGHILVAGGGDGRKNVEVAIRAHARNLVHGGARIPLVITGSYPETWKTSLSDLHIRCGGRPGLVRFPGYVGDAELVALTRDAICIVVPSRSEGFSIPVVEGMAVGTPVFASSIPAHRELIENPFYLFDPDDDTFLAELLKRVMTEPGFRERVVEAQCDSWQAFVADEIARSFWTNVMKAAPKSFAAPLVGGRRPQVAIFSPLPPDRSGVADYTAASLKELGKHVDVHAFTAAQSPIFPPGAQSVGPITILPQLSRRFDRVINVMGNSHFHKEIFDLQMRYGGACIQHDNRLLGFYHFLVGDRRTRQVAERELKRPLEPGELEKWLGDESTLEATFLGEIVERSHPVCVHSRGSAQIIRDRFGVEPVYLPFSVYRGWSPDQFDAANRVRARDRLGIPRDEVMIISLGYLNSSKAPEDCIWALEMLHGWNIRAKLYFVGEMQSDIGVLASLRDRLGLASHVRFVSSYVPEDVYRDYLLAADAGLQLRTHLLGGLSGALLDCIAVGLPAVANCDLANSLDAPDFVAAVPDRASPVLIAEALANILGKRGSTAIDDARIGYCDEHSFRVYAKRLCEALSLHPAALSTAA